MCLSCLSHVSYARKADLLLCEPPGVLGFRPSLLKDPTVPVVGMVVAVVVAVVVLVVFLVVAPNVGGTGRATIPGVVVVAAVPLVLVVAGVHVAAA